MGYTMKINPQFYRLFEKEDEIEDHVVSIQPNGEIDTWFPEYNINDEYRDVGVFSETLSAVLNIRCAQKQKINMDNIIKKTGYNWCLEANIRLLKMLDWDTNMSDCEESYFTEEIDAKEFYRRLELCTIKPNSQPRKTDKYLNYRMYGLVPYNLSPIQQGIQYGHAVVRYGRTVRGINLAEIIYNKWADKDETFIILNGGTTNNNLEKLGTLNKYLLTLREADILAQDFYEPDLGDQLTAICFLVDERVFDRITYPDFISESIPWGKKKPTEKELSILDEKNRKNYELWVDKIGGPKNAFLREYLKPFRLA